MHPRGELIRAHAKITRDSINNRLGEQPETGIIDFNLVDGEQRGLAITVALATMIFFAVSIFASSGSVIEDPTVSSTLRFTAQTIVMFVSFGVFFILWLPPKERKSVQIIFIAVGFLSTGFLTFANIMTCAEQLNIVESAEAPVGSFFHMMSGITMTGTLLIAAYIPSHRRVVRNESNLLLLGSLTYTAIVVTMAALFGSAFPSLCPHDANVDATRMIIEFVMIGALFVAMAKYYAIGRSTHDRTFSYLACAAFLGTYIHIAFTIHKNPYDGYSLLSTLFTIASFVLVFVALFSTSVIQPYDRLKKAQKHAERRRMEAEAATVKAQTYLDFLGHDIVNMISPVMNRAEIILQSQYSPEEDKEEARKIVEQVQKAASLIVNLGRLSRTDRIDVNGLGAVDLRALLTNLVRTRRETHHAMDLRVDVRIPDDPDIRVLGGSVAEEIIAEIFDNAIKHSRKKSTSITISVFPEKNNKNKAFWIVEVLDDGLGIPDHTKSALNITSSDLEKRFTRGVASSLTIMFLIAERIGGRIRIEDRVPGDYTQGTRVVITLPMAPEQAHTDA